MKTVQDYLAEANAVVPKIEFEDALAKHKAGTALFIDVRDTGMIAESGTVAGAERIPRGMLEFLADPATPFFNEKLQKDADIILLCGKGGQAALAGKTLVDMGFQNVSNVGGFPDWKEKGGPSEDG